MASKYIKEREYEEFVKRNEKRNILIVPVMFAPCDFTKWEDLAKLQFFKPNGADYDKATVRNFTYADLIKFRDTDGTVIPNPNTNRYHLDLLGRIEHSYSAFLTISPPTNSIAISEAPVKGNTDVPKPKPYFTGRDTELAEFKLAIENGAKLILIDGPGGIGKTEFASRCIQKFIPEDKAIWFDCATASQFDTLISEAGFPEILVGGNKSDRDKFSAFKDKIQEGVRTLFLDNFQDTNSNPVFLEFLKFIQTYLGAGRVVVLDRDNLRSVDLPIKRIPLKGFEKERLDYAKALIGYSYANEVNIGDNELDSLCAELQGYPLAIDFAIQLLSEGATPRDIVAKIADEQDAHKISERLLNAIFERPDATEEEREFMRQFSVFNSAVNEEAINSVLPDNVIKNAVKRLQRKNLLLHKNDVYSVHPLVREFCYKELDQPIPIHARAADFFITKRTAELNPSLEEVIFYHLSKSEQWGRIESEIEKNGRQYILKGQLGLVKELLDKLKELNIYQPVFSILYGDIAEIQGQWDLAQQHYNAAQGQDIHPAIKAEGMTKYGEMLFRKGESQTAISYFKSALDFSTQHGFKKTEARALNDIGHIKDLFGDLGGALETYQSALKMWIDIGDDEGIAASLGSIGNVYQTTGETGKALDYHQRSLKIKEKIGNRQGIAISLSNIGSVYQTTGETGKALDYHQRNLKIEEEIGNRQGIAVSLGSIGSVYQTTGETGKALDYHQRSLKIKEEIGNRQGIAASLGSIGSVYQTTGETGKALDYHQRSLKINEEIGNRQGIATSLGNIGSVYFEKNYIQIL